MFRFEARGLIQTGRRLSPRWSRICGIMLGCLLAMGSRDVWAAGEGSIQGMVRHQGQGVADHRIMLIRFGPQQEVKRTPGQTDAEGRFVFEGLEAGAELTYVVGIRFGEQLYRSAPIVLEPGQQQEGVIVEIGEQGSEAAETTVSQVHIAHHLMAFIWRDARLTVREVVEIVNPTSTPYQGTSHADQGIDSLHLPLPEGYADFQNLQGLPAEHIQLHASGISYTAPLEPGSHRVAYSYTLPIPDGVAVVLARRTLATQLLDVLVEDTHLVAASDLQFRGRAPIESHSFFHFRGTELQAHSRSWIQLTQLTGSVSLIRLGSYGLTIGIALLGMLTPLRGLWQARTSRMSEAPFTAAQIQQRRAAHLRLLHTIARLDDQHEAGRLDAETYQQRRRACKKQLLDIVEQLRAAQQDKESVS
jgi:hypothetical protein